ncbi:MAG: Rpn family recombination-promoting nuclease/putative transposase [Methylococcaceae bacterium]
MRHAIDPKIDCVFKALLGSEENRNLLIHFLNAFLAQDLIEPLVWVEILNPYNDREFLSDKLSIVDVKARDSHDRLYQIEIQLTSYGHLPARIIYNWADIYSQQLKSGQDYLQLRPTYSIWLLAENLISDDNETVHHYKMRDEQGNTLTQHGGIWLLELKKFKANHIETEDQRWLKFFREGEQLNDEALPDWMITREMKQAMSTLSTFSEKDQHYYQYQARQEYLREQRTIQHELEQARRALLQANQREEAAKKREEAALQEKQAAQKREELALQEKQAAQNREELALQEKQAAQNREELALQEKQAVQQREELAIAEIEHLKALLAQKE